MQQLDDDRDVTDEQAGGSAPVGGVPGGGGVLAGLEELVAAGRFGEALEGARGVVSPPAGPDEVLAARCVEAWCLSRLGDDVGAYALAADTYGRGVAVLGATHPVTLTALDRLARFEHRLGSHAEALVHGAEVFAARRATLGPAHRDTLRSATNLLRYRLGRGDQPSVSDAERLLDEWYRIDPERRDRAHLAAMHLELQVRRRALAHDAAALLERYRATLGAEHPDTLRAAAGLADLARDPQGT